nr:CMT1A duplicated region transcript 4 protein isoform X1 [Oryctolagus cuniculus]
MPRGRMKPSAGSQKPSKMNDTKDLQELPAGRSEQEKRSYQGILTYDLKNCIKLKEKTDIRKLKTQEGLTANIGLPLELVDKHDPWPGYVTYTSPVVKRLIEKSKTRELECANAFEESRRAAKPNKASSIVQLKRRKSSKSSSEAAFQDVLSQAMLSVWGAYSVLAVGPAISPEPTCDSPTATHNKILFSRRPVMRLLPYSSLLASKEKHANV